LSSASSSRDGEDNYRGTVLLLLFDLIAENSARRLGEFDAPELGGLVCLFENSGLVGQHARLFDMVANHIIPNSPEDEDVIVLLCEDGFELRKITTVLLAYARAGHGSRLEDTALFDDLAKAGIRWKEDLNNLIHYNN